MFSNDPFAMKIAIIQFSPSGNTLAVSAMLQQELEARGLPVQVVDVARCRQVFRESKLGEFLSERIRQHDVLLVGGPVYAHHLQYHVKDLIAALPKPDATWGQLAIPFVTYGGISSGIALREAQRLLQRSGRRVPAALKVVASHRMTRAFMPEEFNRDKLRVDMLPQVVELVNRIVALGSSDMGIDYRQSFHYNGLATLLKAKLIFKEKVWHQKRYPNIAINHALCTRCGRCVATCPVLHLEKLAESVVVCRDSACIHCLSCVSGCPQKAITLQGNLERGKAFMAAMIARKGNREVPATAVYPILASPMLSGKSRIGNFLFKKMLDALVAGPRHAMSNPADTLKAADVHHSASILEVGCGSGFYTLPASQLISPTSHYLAIDIHPLAVQETRRRLDDHGVANVEVRQANALSTLLPDGAFDSILLFGVIPSPFLPVGRLIPEMVRLLQPGGVLSVFSVSKLGLRRSIIRSGGLQYLGCIGGVLKFVRV
jgi:ferredoxin/flavodoxin